jgi:hypothetical protein
MCGVRIEKGNDDKIYGENKSHGAEEIPITDLGKIRVAATAAVRESRRRLFAFGPVLLVCDKSLGFLVRNSRLPKLDVNELR